MFHRIGRGALALAIVAAAAAPAAAECIYGQPYFDADRLSGDPLIRSSYVLPRAGLTKILTNAGDLVSVLQFDCPVRELTAVMLLQGPTSAGLATSKLRVLAGLVLAEPDRKLVVDRLSQAPVAFDEPVVVSEGENRNGLVYTARRTPGYVTVEIHLKAN